MTEAATNTNAAWLAREKAVVMQTYGRYPLALVRGEGAYVWDADGRRYLDFLAGIAVNILGHCHPAVVAAIQQQAATLLHTSNLYVTPPMVELAELLVQTSFADRVFFSNSGAEANEGAVKLARRWAKAHGGPDGRGGAQRGTIITAFESFHGRTLAMLAATGQEKYREGFEPIPAGFRHVPFGDLDAVRAAIDDTTAAVMVEPIQGEGGIHPGSAAYLQGLRRLCDEAGVLLIFDEIQCGTGRTGKLWAHEWAGVTPDVLTSAKGLGGGLPIGAILATEQVAQVLGPGTHATTFGGNPVACAAALATMRTLLGGAATGSEGGTDAGLLTQVQAVGERLQAGLRQVAARSPHAVEVRGQGLMVGLELTVPGAPVVDACRERGLLINVTQANVLRFVPPLIVTEAQVDEAVAIVGEALGTLPA